MQAALAFPFAFGMRPFAELRIDVELPPWGVESELRRLHDRMRREGDPLCGLPVVRGLVPGFAFRWREADGELYVYVEDLASGRLAGYTVFNRLVELGRQADRHLRAPHSKYSRHYQRRGLASAVYRWALERGMCLISGARQSQAAHGLWLSLAARHELGYFQLKSRQLSYLGAQVAPGVLADFDTRMVLLGSGWTLERFAAETGARMPEPVAA